MGKFRAKPTRAVAKPFKRKPALQSSPSPSSIISSMQIDDIKVPGGKNFVIATVDPSKFKVSKKSTKSALKKKAAAAQSPKKSVTFATTNLTHIYSAKKESVQDILKQGAGALVNLVAGGARKLLQNKNKSSYTFSKTEEPLVITSNSLNKVLKNEFKNKKTRRKLRKEAFKKKLTLIKASEDELKAEKKRKQTVIVGDIQPIAKILEELETEENSKKVATVLKQKPAPSSAKKGLKKREQEFLEALKIFESVRL